MTEHIKMPAIEPVVRYLANGQQSVFEYPFPIFASEDIQVFLNGAMQFGGFTVAGSGNTEGGTVTFDTPPAEGMRVTIKRQMPYERVTDFLEGGDFAADAINGELDYLTGGLQQLARDQKLMLQYELTEGDVINVLPGRDIRANHVLGFDGDGRPVAVSTEGTMAAPDYTAVGTGAVTRTTHDKFSETVSIKDFGASGDGFADDTPAIQQAIAASNAVFIPEGIYVISSPIRLTARQALFGAGQKSVIKCSADMFSAIEVVEDYITLRNFRIEGGKTGIHLYGLNRPCVQNSVSDIHLIAPQTGILLDGYNDTNYPCYWNNFTRVLIEQPSVNGVHLTRTGGGDTPNANKFHDVRVQSKSAPISGSGFYIEHGAFNNSLIDCEANVDGTAQACFRIGANSNKTLLINPYAESFNVVPNIRLESGSVETAVINLLSASDGAAIWDLSGGEYIAINAGFPTKNRLNKTSVTDLTATLMRYDTEFVDTPGLTEVDLSHTVHIVNAVNGAVEMRLPPAGTAPGVTVMIKKIDNAPNLVSITEAGQGPGPDRRTLELGGYNDYAVMISNGAEWFIVSSNRMAGNTRFFDGTGIFDIDMTVDVYLLSAFGGALTARLPPADAANAAGRQVTVKKTDSSANVITVSEQGGSGPDQYSQPLNSQYEAITVVSDGNNWFIVSRFEAG